MATGKVYRSTGSNYTVKDDEGKFHQLVLTGRLRTTGSKSTNPVAVGDVVDFSLDQEVAGGITAVHERKNHIIRRSVNLSKRTQVIAANIDQAILLVTLASPPTSTGFIDRFLVTAEVYTVPSIILFNKIDLYTEAELEVLEQYRLIYEQIGYPCFSISAKEGIGISAVSEMLLDKTTLISGHSGAGKSTFINAIQPGLGLRVNQVSSYHKKGQHTTTFAEMFDLDMGGTIIDTPGIKGFGLVGMEAEVIGDQFPEILELKENCRFNNCLHQSEPGCKVREAAEAGRIASSRYNNYLGLIAECNDDGPYRENIYAE